MKSRTLISLLLSMGFALLLFTGSGCDPDATYTTVYVVRHAEKENPEDPNSLLSAVGHQRAEALVDRLSDSGITGVYASDYERTQQTVAPTAEALGLEISIFPWQQHEDMVADMLTHHSGSAVLVAGHSNTVSPIIETLGGDPVTVGEEEYDNLWIVIHSSNGTAGVAHVTY